MLASGLKMFGGADQRTLRQRVLRGVPPELRWMAWKHYLFPDEFLTGDVGALSSNPELLRLLWVFEFSSECVRYDSYVEYKESLVASNEAQLARFCAQLDTATLQELYQKLVCLPTEYSAIIELDVKRTIPQSELFGHAEEMLALRVLDAFTAWAPHVGYCQGMNFIIGLLIVVANSCADSVSEVELWCMLVFVMRDLDLSFMYRKNFPLLHACLDLFQRSFAENLPRLHNHFCQQGVTPDLFLHGWFLGMFVSTFPVETSSVLWDGIVFFGVSYVVNIALGVLNILSLPLLSKDFEGIIVYLKTLKKGKSEANAVVGRTILRSSSVISTPQKVYNWSFEYYKCLCDEKTSGKKSKV